MELVTMFHKTLEEAYKKVIADEGLPVEITGHITPCTPTCAPECKEYLLLQTWVPKQSNRIMKVLKENGLS